MSSMTITQPAPIRLTRRGQVVLVAVFMLCALGLMTVFGGFATATGEAGSLDVRYVEVKPGDTLYGLAADYAEPGEIREVVHQIRELNGVGSVLQPGTEIAIPLG